MRTHRSPGYALTLLATSSTGVLHSAEVAASDAHQTPEDAALAAARALLAEVAAGGCVDRGAEWLVMTMMALGGEDIRRCRVAGPLDLFAYVAVLSARQLGPDPVAQDTAPPRPPRLLQRRLQGQGGDDGRGRRGGRAVLRRHGLRQHRFSRRVKGCSHCCITMHRRSPPPSLRIVVSLRSRPIAVLSPVPGRAIPVVVGASRSTSNGDARGRLLDRVAEGVAVPPLAVPHDGLIARRSVRGPSAGRAVGFDEANARRPVLLGATPSGRAVAHG
jgi:hypothetical protein